MTVHWDVKHQAKPKNKLKKRHICLVCNLLRRFNDYCFLFFSKVVMQQKTNVERELALRLHFVSICLPEVC